MASLANINIRFAVDLKQFSTEMQNSLRTIDKVGQKFQSVGRNMSTFVTLPILAAGAAAVKFASDYNESLNKVDVSFKTSSGEVKDFAKTSLESFGIASGTALDMASTFGDMSTSMGLPTSQAAKMSTSLVGLAGDLASFKNISIDVANTALTGVFSGETESLKKLGIVITEVNLKQFALASGIKKNYEQMSQAEKVQLRYNYILSVTKNAQGDFIRTQGGAANQMRIFQESLKQVGAELGQVVLPLFTKLIAAVNQKIVAFSKLSETTKTTIVVVAGLVAVIGPLALAIGGILAAIPFVIAGFTAISAAILPLFAGIVLLMGVFLILKDNTKAAASAQNELNKAVDAGNKAATAEVTALDRLYAAATNVKLSTDKRKEAVDQLQILYPAYFKNIDAEIIKNGKAETSYNQLRNAIFNKSRAAAIDGELQNRANERIKNELKIRDDISATEKEIIRLKKGGNTIVLQEANGIEKTRQVTISKSDAIAAQTKLLVIQNAQLKKFNEDALKADETLLNAKQVYDAKSAKLSENEIARKKAEGQAVVDVVKPAKETKAKAPDNLESVNLLGDPQNFKRTIEAYDEQIAALEKFKYEVATTAAEVKKADADIAQIEFAKNLIFSPESLIQVTGGFDALISEMEAKVGGMKSVTDAVATNMVDFGAILSVEVEKLSENLAVGFGEAIGGLISGTASLGDVVGGMMAMIGGFMKDLGKSLIAAGIAGIAFKKLFANPYVAVAAGIALVALSSVVEAKMSKGPKMQAFANGGIVGGASFYGDKIMARVNSGELIANSEQQKRIWGAMSAGNNVNVTIGGGFELDGTKIRLVLDRTDKRKSRTS